MPPWIDIRAPLVNPLGNPLSQYSSATWINLGQPGVLVDFTAFRVGTPLAAGALPGGGTYTQAAGSNQTEETVQTSASTVARWAFVANLPRIGLLADGGIGLVLEPPRTNLLFRSDAIDHAFWVKNPVITVNPNATTSPTGAIDAETVTGSDGNGYIASTLVAVAGATQTFYGTSWLQADTSRSLGIQVPDFPDGVPSGQTVATVGTSWGRFGISCNFDATTPAVGLIFGIPTRFGVGSTFGIWGAQLEKGKFPTNLIPTTTVAVGRAGFRVSIPLSRYVRGGVFRAVLTTVPHGAATEYDGDSATIRLWTIDANTYAEVNTTTRVLTVLVNGVARVAGVPLWWLRGHRVQWSWEVGGGNLRVRYRYSTDQGATWTLPFDPFGGTVYSDSAISTASSTIDLYSDSGSSKWWGTGVVSEEAILTAPAWALQALPTDVASVKAFFRLDTGYTLSSTTVSVLAGNTATAVTSFTQGAGANQPTFQAAGFGTARPSILLDGAGDFMAAGALSEWIAAGAGAVYLLIKPTAATAGGAQIWEDASSQAGLRMVSGPLVRARNDDGAADVADQATTLSTAQVVRWRHAGGNVYSRVGSTESAGVASGNTASLAGLNRIGWNATGMTGHIGAIVAMNTDPTAGEDAAIMAFLNAYGGL